MPHYILLFGSGLIYCLCSWFGFGFGEQISPCCCVPWAQGLYSHVVLMEQSNHSTVRVVFMALARILSGFHIPTSLTELIVHTEVCGSPQIRAANKSQLTSPFLPCTFSRTKNNKWGLCEAPLCSEAKKGFSILCVSRWGWYTVHSSTGSDPTMESQNGWCWKGP